MALTANAAASDDRADIVRIGDLVEHSTMPPSGSVFISRRGQGIVRNTSARGLRVRHRVRPERSPALAGYQYAAEGGIVLVLDQITIRTMSARLCARPAAFAVKGHRHDRPP